MAERIEFPIYYEDQILGAGDLNAAVELSTGQIARHARTAHTWGIVTGLELVEEPKTSGSTPYVDVTCTAGLAIDGWGREIIVPEDELLNPLSFADASVFASGKLHPVFLIGRDEDAAVPSLAMGACFSAETSRRSQSHVIEFGRPGSQFDLDDQTPAAALDGPGSGGWKILLGYVGFDSTLQKFTSVAATDEGVGPVYTGVMADEVVARSGKLVVRSRGADRAGTPALALDDADGGSLVFGLQDGSGGIAPLLTVDSEGNLTAAGTVRTEVVSDAGIVSDGMLIPLPGTLTEEKVAAGKITLNIHVSPLFTPGPPDPTSTDTDWVIYPRECRVVDRRVKCLFTWQRLTPAPPAVLHLPGVCSYSIVAYVPKE